MKYFQFCSLLIALLLAWQNGKGQSALAEVQSVDSAHRAAEIAMQYMGNWTHAKIRTLEVVGHTTSIVMIDTCTPFIGSYLDGRSCWEVPLWDVQVDLDREPVSQGTAHTKDIYVYIDSLTGKLARIRILDHGLPKSHRELRPSRNSAEAQLSQNAEVYGGLPDSGPRMSLVEVMNSTLTNPLECREIDAYFIMYQYLTAKMYPTWIVNCYGKKPMLHPGSEHLPVELRNHVRHLVNDSTGHAWSRLTPQPISWPPKTDSLQRIREDLPKLDGKPAPPPPGFEENSGK